MPLSVSSSLCIWFDKKNATLEGMTNFLVPQKGVVAGAERKITLLEDS